MNKEQSADDPVIFTQKICRNSTSFMSYPDVAIACIEHGASAAFRAIEAALV